MVNKKVAILMGSKNDMPVVEKSIDKLKEFEIETKVYILSAHKSPNITISFAKKADREFGIIIAAAGMAAHLAGIVAANTTLPVIGLPIKCGIEGLDSLFSTVQMPKGVPVLTVGINAAENAAIAACQILALYDDLLKEKLQKMKENLEKQIIEQNKNL